MWPGMKKLTISYQPNGHLPLSGPHYPTNGRNGGTPAHRKGTPLDHDLRFPLVQLSADGLGHADGLVGDSILSGLHVCFRTLVLLLTLLFHIFPILAIAYGLQVVWTIINGKLPAAGTAALLYTPSATGYSTAVVSLPITILFRGA